MRKNIIFVASLLATQIFYAQLGNDKLSDDKFLPNMIPPSPSAYSLGKFGNLEVGEFTGTPNINIPLLQFKGKGLSTDLSLSYTSSGIKVDEKDGQFGLGWTLVAGGVINRIVRGKNDFEGRKLTPPDNFNNGIYDPKVAQFFFDAGTGSLDTENDLFSFNVGNINGQFVINNERGIELLSKDDIKFKIDQNAEYNPYFIMKDSKGLTYYFTDIEETFTRVANGPSHSPPSPTTITAWFLTKIENLEGEQILFEYEEDVQRYTMSKSQTLSYSDPYIQTDCEYHSETGGVPKMYSKAPTLGTIISNDINNFGKRLKKITGNSSKERIEFQYDTEAILMTHYYDQNVFEKLNFQINKTSNDRLFLNSINSLTKSKDYKFEYIQPNAFPPRLAFSQDHWGYFNGKINSNIIPINIKYLENLNNVNYYGADKEPDHSKSVYGVLNKVIYPTKGWTTIEYEPNTYNDWVTVNPEPITVIEGLVTNRTERHLTNAFIIQTPVQQMIKLEGYGSFNARDCPSSLDLGIRHRIDFSINNLQTNQAVLLNGIDSQGNSNGSSSSVSFEPGNSHYYQVNLQAGIPYEFKLFANWNCTNGSVNFKYYNQTPVKIKKNIPVGGNRVARMIDFDGKQQFIKRYYYASKNNLDSSSGDKGLDPFYIDFRKWLPVCIGMEPLRDAVITSSSIYPLFDSGRSNVYYQYVTTSFGGDNFEKGGVEKEYTVNRDYWGNQIFGSDNVGSAPWTNFGWNNGYLRTEKFFDNQNAILKVNDYLWEKKNLTDNKSYYVRKNYTPQLAQSPVYYCTNEDVIRSDNGSYWVCTTDHHHLYSTGSGKCTLLNSHNEKRYILNPCYQKPSGFAVIHASAIENLDIVEYNNISYQKYLKSVTTTDYVNNQPMKSTITENAYDGNLHYQQTSKKVTHLDNSITENGYQYAHEKGNQRLINANMVGVPLETSTTERRNVNDTSGKITSKVETKYDNPTLLLPTSVVSTDLQNVAKTEITYDKYDDKGNLQQYTTKDGISTVIIWGYNNTYPIAKIENVRYADVSQSLITDLVNASNIDASAGKNNDETDLLNSFNTFRNGLFRYQVTTYTYDPLIGVRSITPPSGIREVYLYDSANRLEKVVDVDGKVLKEMKYNYKN